MDLEGALILEKQEVNARLGLGEVHANLERMINSKLDIRNV